MGGKTKTTTEPSKFAKPYIQQGAGALNTAYNANSGAIQGATNQVVGLLPSIIDKYKAGNPAVNAATDYTTNVLNGDYLGGNPYLEGVVQSSNDDVRNQTQAALGNRGLTGGSAYADIISRNIGRNSNDLRFADYSRERGAQDSAASRAPSLSAADVIQITPMLAALQASTTPVGAAGEYAGGLGGLFGQYSTTTQKNKPGFADYLGLGLQGASLLSDARAKEDIREVGMTDGGLPVYTYRYIGDSTVHMGVMAQDVEAQQPDALGPDWNGYMTVDYGRVR